MPAFGRTLIIIGLLIVLAGVLVSAAGKLPWLGRLPGDIHIRRGSFSFYFPLATCLILSILISLILRIFRK